MRKTFLLIFFMVAALLPQSSWATVTVVFSGDNNEIATVTTDNVNGEPFDFASLSSDDQNKFRSCTTVNFTGKFTSISNLPDNPVTVSYNSTTIAVSNEKFTVSASDGQADLTVLRSLLTGKEFDFDSGITSVDYATYSLEFSDNQTTVDIIAKDGSTVALTLMDSEKDVLFINSHCTTIKFSGDGVFSDLTAFTNGNKVATTVDFSEANFSNASVMTFKYWGATITTGKGSASLDTYPDDVIQSCNNLTTLTFGNGIATIDRTTNPRTITFTSSSYDIKYSRVEAAFNRDGYNDYTKVFDQSVTSIDMGDYVFNFSGNYDNTTNCYDGVTIIAKAGKSVSLNAGNQGSMLYTIKENCTSVAFRGEGTFTSLDAFQNDPHNQTTIDFTGANFSEGVRKAGYWKGKVTKVFYNGAEATVDGENVTIKSSGDETTDNELKAMFTADSKWQESNITITGGRTDVEETTYENRVLTFASAIIDAEGLTTAASGISGGFCDATKIIFPDGSEWVKEDADGKSTLTCTTGNYTIYREWIEAQTGTCSNVKIDKAILGNYVTVEGNVTTVTLPATGTIGSNVDSGNDLTPAERTALGDVTTGNTLKLVGPFSDVDVTALAHKCHPSKLDLSDAVIPDGNNVEGAVTLKSNFLSTVTEVVLPNDADYKKVPSNFATNATNLTTISFPSSVTVIGSQAFQGCTNLNLTQEQWGNSIVEIEEHAFERCGFGPTLIIPNSVKYIREDAFRNCYNVNYLYIQEGSMLEIVESGVFFNDERDMPGLKEVHVDCNHFIWCDIDAFDDTHTNGHTDVATAKCRLFYPAVGISDYDPDYPEVVTESENKNSFQDFVGVFKSRLFNGRMKQSDLQTLKTVITQGAEINGVQYGPYPGHGWFMFTSSGITITPTTTWRTYSEAVNFTVPSESLAEIYLVCGYESNGNASVTKLVKMKPGDVIPANTGIIIHYVSDEDYSLVGDEKVLKESVIMSFDYYDSETPLTKIDAEEGVSYVKDEKTYANYLRKLNLEPVDIYNVEKVNGTPTYRNFFFNNATQMNNLDAEGQEKWWGKDWGTDCSNLKGWGFFRAKTGNYTVNNKAYLHLPANMASETAGASTTSEVSTNVQACAIVIINDDNTTTKIDNVVISQENLKLVPDCYYTLSGQRVMTPVKGGIYIHNGKKVIVK